MGGRGGDEAVAAGLKATVVIPAVRCGATKRNGQPCGAWGLRGSDPSRCRKHGGDLPVVKAKAARNVELAKIELSKLASPIVQAWANGLTDPDINVRLTAAREAARYVFDARLQVNVEGVVRVGG